MTRLSSAQQETIRTRPQATKLYMSIFQPQIVFKGVVDNVSIARGARTTAYTTSGWNYLDIKENFTMWVGTTEEGQELGKIRVRSASASEIIVSENSNIDWQNGAHLTVFRYVELWPIFPRIVQTNPNSEDVTFYKDYDIPYTNQNSILGTFVNMGPHRATCRS